VRPSTTSGPTTQPPNSVIGITEREPPTPGTTQPHPSTEPLAHARLKGDPFGELIPERAATQPAAGDAGANWLHGIEHRD